MLWDILRHSQIKDYGMEPWSSSKLQCQHYMLVMNEKSAGKQLNQPKTIINNTCLSPSSAASRSCWFMDSVDWNNWTTWFASTILPFYNNLLVKETTWRISRLARVPYTGDWTPRGANGRFYGCTQQNLLSFLESWHKHRDLGLKMLHNKSGGADLDKYRFVEIPTDGQEMIQSFSASLASWQSPWVNRKRWFRRILGSSFNFKKTFLAPRSQSS